MEARENPAAVTTSLVGGVLVIMGSDEADAFTIKQGAVAGTCDLTAAMGTTIDGVANVTTLAATSVKMVLKNGNDTVTADAGFPLTITGALTINGGDGNNTINFFTTASPVVIPSFSYTRGEGLDTVKIGQGTTAPEASTIGGAFTVTAGNGGSNVEIDNTRVTGELKVTAGVGDDTATFTRLTANKRVALDYGYGAGNLSIVTATVAGGLSHKAADGSDDVNLNAVTVNGALGVTVAGGVGGANLTTSNVVSVPAGGLSVAGTNGASTVILGGTLTLGKDFKVGNLTAAVTNGAALTAGNVSLLVGDFMEVLTPGAGA